MTDTSLIGLELNEREIRVCVYDTKEKNAVTVMVTAGGSRAESPAHMTWLAESGQWKYGLEADYFSEQKGTKLLDDILEHALSGRSFDADGRVFSCEEVLGELLARAVRFAGVKDPARQIRVLMVTVPQITKTLTQVMKKAFERLGLQEGKKAFLQSYDESFFHYTCSQRPEVYSRDVGLFYFPDETGVCFKRLHMDRSTKPAVAAADGRREESLPLNAKERDEQFSQFLQKCTQNVNYSGFFLVGSGFDKQWAKNSLSHLCRGQRKVFYGNNLFAEGACYAARERAVREKTKTAIFLGSDHVRKNIGIELIADGIAMYYPLITAGIHWYEAKKELELLLNEEKSLVFRVSSMEDGKRQNYSMPLPGLPERPPKTTRLRVRIGYESAERCVITARDMGFGELFPSSGKVWTEVLQEDRQDRGELSAL